MKIRVPQGWPAVALVLVLLAADLFLVASFWAFLFGPAAPYAWAGLGVAILAAFGCGDAAGRIVRRATRLFERK